jgi:hypothetical protein
MGGCGGGWESSRDFGWSIHSFSVVKCLFVGKREDEEELVRCGGETWCRHFVNIFRGRFYSEKIRATFIHLSTSSACSPSLARP